MGPQRSPRAGAGHAVGAGVMALALLIGTTACSSSDRSDANVDTTVAAPTPAFDLIVDNLDGPTQFTNGPGPWLLIAQLAGDENAKTGEVLAVDPGTGQRLTLFSGLDKPTGVAWLNGFVWIMERRRLVRGEWRGAGTTPGALEILLDDLPYNGRSEGTLTVTPDNRLLYATTGSLFDGVAAQGSGTLWVFDPLTKTSTAVATGFKNAYAHTFLPDGRVVSTEIGDATEPPVEEVNVLPYGGPDTTSVDAGWPACPGSDDCEGVISPFATFPARSTPTGIAVDQSSVYVALLVTGEVRRVGVDRIARSTERAARSERAESERVASGLDGPHTIALRPDGTLWVSETFAGRIVAVPTTG